MRETSTRKERSGGRTRYKRHRKTSRSQDSEGDPGLDQFDCRSGDGTTHGFGLQNNGTRHGPHDRSGQDMNYGRQVETRSLTESQWRHVTSETVENFGPQKIRLTPRKLPSLPDHPIPRGHPDHPARQCTSDGRTVSGLTTPGKTVDTHTDRSVTQRECRFRVKDIICPLKSVDVSLPEWRQLRSNSTAGH